jgi:hypothetical protein
VIYNEKGRKTKNAEINNVVCMELLFGSKDGERKILENEKREIKKSRVHCIYFICADMYQSHPKYFGINIYNLIYSILGTTLVNQSSIQEEIKRRLKSGNACYHSVQNILCSRLLSKHIKIYKSKCFLLFCMGVKLGH